MMLPAITMLMKQKPFMPAMTAFQVDSTRFLEVTCSECPQWSLNFSAGADWKQVGKKHGDKHDLLYHTKLPKGDTWI